MVTLRPGILILTSRYIILPLLHGNPIGKKAAGIPKAGAPAKLVRQLKRIGLHAEQLAKGD
jgi:hypothetical protein